MQVVNSHYVLSSASSVRHPSLFLALRVSFYIIHIITTQKSHQPGGQRVRGFQMPGTPWPLWASVWLRAGPDSVARWEIARILEPWKAKFRSWLCSLPACPSGFPGGASGKEPTCQCRRHKRHGLEKSLGQKDPLEEGLATHSRILAWRIP